MKLTAFASKFGKGAITKPIYIYETWLRFVGRGIQFIFSLVVLGLYGSRVSSDHSHDRPQAAQWVFAVFVASLSAVTALAFAIPQPFVRTARLFIWDFVIFGLYIAIFAIFAIIFLRIPHGDEEDPEELHKWYENTRVSTMRHAVWIDLVNAIFWLFTGAYGCFRTFVSRKVDETIDSKLGAIEDKVSEKIGESNVGSKLGAAGSFASKAMPYVGPKLPPKVVTKFGRFAESV